MEGTIGEIRMFAGNFAPRAWAFCQGQLLPISQNTALFSIIGTVYGGDGRTTFALPDLRGRTAIGPGNGPGLSIRREGQRVGGEFNVLNTSQLPSHHHVVNASSVINLAGTIDKDQLNNGLELYGTADAGSSQTPAGNMLAKTGLTDKEYAPSNNKVAMEKGSAAFLADVPFTAQAQVAAHLTANAGESQAINNMQPSLAVYYIICLQGVFPSRS